MVFGEIVEPSTRAYLDEDECEYKDVEWIKVAEVPDKINTLLVVESPFAIKLVHTALLSAAKLLAQSKHDEICVYGLENFVYVIVCNVKENVSIGEVTEYILPWVKIAKTIHTLTTAPAATYQDPTNQETSAYFIKSLSTSNIKTAPTLKTPNMVTGVGANVMSFAVHTKLNCTLFIGYIDHTPLDSLNSKPFIELLQKLKYSPNLCVLKEKLPANNLYM